MIKSPHGNSADTIRPFKPRWIFGDQFDHKAARAGAMGNDQVSHSNVAEVLEAREPFFILIVS